MADLERYITANIKGRRMHLQLFPAEVFHLMLHQYSAEMEVGLYLFEDPKLWIQWKLTTNQNQTLSFMKLVLCWNERLNKEFYYLPAIWVAILFKILPRDWICQGLISLWNVFNKIIVGVWDERGGGKRWIGIRSSKTKQKINQCAVKIRYGNNK